MVCPVKFDAVLVIPYIVDEQWLHLVLIIYAMCANVPPVDSPRPQGVWGVLGAQHLKSLGNVTTFQEFCWILGGKHLKSLGFMEWHHPPRKLREKNLTTDHTGVFCF